jgi:hydroxymethylbilane synthase
MKIRIGSRGSDLALWQAHFVKDQLEKLGHEVDITIIVTKGDRIQNLSFDKLEGKGFFTKEIEEALLRKEIDLAVHSHKDLETTNPDGLIIGAVSYRENPADVLLIHARAFDSGQKFSLKEKSVIGTSAARRKSQLLRILPGCSIQDLRGNVPTRVDKLRKGEYDAIVLAKAGIDRLKLDMSGIHVVEFSAEDFVPAPAQGVLALQIRQEDQELKQSLQAIHHEDVSACIHVEREVMRLLQGGCQLPLGVYCKKTNEVYETKVSYSRSSAEPGHCLTYTETELHHLPAKIVNDLKLVIS